MKKNKIISKTLRPYVGALAVVASVGLLTIGAIDKVAPKLKKDYKISDNFIFGANVVGIGFIAYIFLTAVLWLYNNANGFANEITKKYISKKMAECPEYDQFQNVLKKPDAIKRIATLISNELRENEQKNIIETINKMELVSTDKQIDAIYDKIVQIIEEHASIHPEFVTDVYGALARESYDIYLKQKQNKNARLLSQSRTK